MKLSGGGGMYFIGFSAIVQWLYREAVEVRARRTHGERRLGTPFPRMSTANGTLFRSMHSVKMQTHIGFKRCDQLWCAMFQYSVYKLRVAL